MTPSYCIFYFRTPLRWMALVPVVVWPLVSAAQTPVSSASPISSASPTTPAPLAFKSAFEVYQPYTDDQTGNWRQANDTVERIGGWRAYAKEAAAETAKPSPAAPASLTPEPSPKTRLEPAATKP